ncbi:MAG: XkdX family protein [Faecalispora sporosphaeroides]|nr:MAG TPA: hypothetical protein [Caudoviricetes sp.]
MAFWTLAYSRGWASKVQLGQAVAKEQITAAEYKEITGEVYTDA